MKQKVLTPEQYAALGYVQRPDFVPQMFDVKPDKPLSEPYIDRDWETIHCVSKSS